IEAVSGTPAHTEPKPVKAPSAKYSYLNAPIVKSRPCPLCGEFLEADTIFCPKCNNRVASRYDEALILRRQGKVPVKKADEKKPEPTAPKKTEAPVAEKKPEPTAPKKAEAPVAEKKPEPTASKKAEAPVAEKKPEPAAPKKAEAPIAEKKHEPKISKAPANLVIKVKGSYTKPVMNPHFTAADDFDD
ncbi:MAG: hypothetical protein IJ779_01745, partial [Ruminococcus sp.]|nr:hypothetical protein [Ruminococcus sp.]